MSRNVCVLGLGYIGLPTASLLATKGHQVLGVDVDPDIVATIGRGDIHLVEPDLDVLVRSAVQSGNLKAALEPSPADVFITPLLSASGFITARCIVDGYITSGCIVSRYITSGCLVSSYITSVCIVSL